MATKINDYEGRLTGAQIDALPGRMAAVEQKVESFEAESSEYVEEGSESEGIGIYAEDIMWRGDENPDPDSLAAHILAVETALTTANTIADEIIGE